MYLSLLMHSLRNKVNAEDDAGGSVREAGTEPAAK